VQESTCLIRPPAMNADFLKPLTPSIIVAAEGCPVEVIKYDTATVEGPAPWANQPAGEPAAAGVTAQAKAPATKVASPLGPPDPRMQALISTSKISPSLSAGLATTVRKSPQVIQAEEGVAALNLREQSDEAEKKTKITWENAPPDYRMANLAAFGAYQPSVSLGDRLRARAAKLGTSSRREFSIALAIGWAALAFAGATFGAMFQDFFGPKVLKEPKKQLRVGTIPDFSMPGVNEQYKPDGIWMVNLAPGEPKLVALSTTCTHLGCIPNWLAGDQKFKCPCHGSGYYMNGVNFEGPTPRPLERYAISKDADGYVWVDKSRVFRSELGEWDDPESFIAL